MTYLVTENCMLVTDTNDAIIRTNTLDICYSIPSYKSAPLNVKNRIYDLMKIMIESRAAKHYLHYEHWTSEDVKYIAENYSTIDIYDYICIQGLEDEVWGEWSDLTDEERVTLFLNLQKYPSIAMRELDDYISGDAVIVNQLVDSYIEYHDMGDPIVDEAREWIRRDVEEGNYNQLKADIECIVKDYELDLADMPETRKALIMLDKLIANASY